MVAKIATGEVEDVAPDEGKNRAAQELGRKGRKKRAETMNAAKRNQIAKIQR
ncbi:MAG: hypothetical protein ABR878_01610 [Roseiarcus sp.]|jgi:hypothetical protein